MLVMGLIASWWALLALPGRRADRLRVRGGRAWRARRTCAVWQDFELHHAGAAAAVPVLGDVLPDLGLPRVAAVGGAAARRSTTPPRCCGSSRPARSGSARSCTCGARRARPGRSAWSPAAGWRSSCSPEPDVCRIVSGRYSMVGAGSREDDRAMGTPAAASRCPGHRGGRDHEAVPRVLRRRRRGPRPDALGRPRRAARLHRPQRRRQVDLDQDAHRHPAPDRRRRARVLGLVPWQQRRQLAARIGTLFGQRSQLWFELHARASRSRMLGRDLRARPRRRAHRASPSSASCSTPATSSTSRCATSRWASGCAASWPPACCTSPRSCSSTSRRSASTCSPSGASASCWSRLNEERRHHRLPHLARRRRHRARRRSGSS